MHATPRHVKTNVTYRNIYDTNTQLSRDMTFQIYTQLEGTLTNG